MQKRYGDMSDMRVQEMGHKERKRLDEKSKEMSSKGDRGEEKKARRWQGKKVAMGQEREGC